MILDSKRCPEVHLGQLAASRRVPAVLLLAAVGMLAACNSPGDRSPTPTSASTATPGSSSSVEPSPGRSATFILQLSTSVPPTTSFGLYLQTDPASIGQDGFAFCGPTTYDPKPCDPSESPFSRRFTGFEVGTTLVYRFELFDGPSRIEVLREGRVVFTGSLTVEVSYP